MASPTVLVRTGGWDGGGGAGDGGVGLGMGVDLEDVFVGNAQVPSGFISFCNLLFGPDKKQLHCL